MGQGSARGYFDGWRRVKYVDFVLSTIASGGFGGITSQELVFSLYDAGSDMTKGSGAVAVMPCFLTLF